MHDVIAGVGWVFLCLATGIVGSFFSMRAIPEWYAGLRKPPWTPPSWVFAPVWTLLYILMGIAATLIWEQGGFTGQRLPLGVFCGQLALNLGWSIVFFGMRKIGDALQTIVLLWCAIVATIVLFFRVDVVAGLLLLPYLLWVSYAALLNSSIWQLNRKPI